MDRKELIEKIRKLEGLTDDERSALLELANTQKRYGLVWEDKPEDVEEKLRDNLPVLTEVKERAIISDNPEAPNHILIEGDNLEALTALTYTHAGKIDVIYIDPPYNTGNKDFVYNDTYIDSENAYRHSTWLSFMSKRLRIAKKLLSDRGVIFISIDDNEQANLKLLCDEVFGGRNFIAQVIWERAYAPVNLKKHFSESHDYILIYAHKIEYSINNGLPRSNEANERYSNPDNDIRGNWKPGDLSVGPAVESNIYPITTPSGRTVLPPSGYSWRLSKEKFQKYIEENRIWFGPSGDNVPAIKRFLKDVKQGITPMTIWKYTDVGHSQDATKEVKDIFNGEARFTYPKSLRLIKRIIHLYSQRDSYILDFFAGSGTTMHAVMQLNAEDGGHRQCILVTNNENGICENVTYERNKRVINGYTKPNGQAVEGLHNNSLRYYRTELVSRDRTSANKQRLVHLATDLLCIKEDLHDEHQLMINGKKLRRQYARFFAKDDRNMIVIYDPAVIKYVVESIKEEEPRRPVKVYVFSYGRYAFDDDFAAVIDKVELCALPDAIYEAYSAVLPTRKDKNVVPADYDKEDAEVELAQADSSSYKSTENDNQL